MPHSYLGQSRVHNFYTPTHFPIFPSTVPTSAYPGHYPRPLRLGGSRPIWHLVGTYSVKLRAQMGLPRSNLPFEVPLGSSYPPGLAGVNLGHCKRCQAPILYLVGPSLLVHVGLLGLTMVQPLVRCLPIDTCWQV